MPPPSDTDAQRVVDLARSAAGQPYGVTRELATAPLVDCSTLVSQAHWEGAGLVIPFVAENQRRALNGLRIDVRSATVGDVLFFFDGTHPRRPHNHSCIVADRSGDWIEVVEARPDAGVAVTIYPTARFTGGAIRFLRDPAPSAIDALFLASSVPKLGRLGARLTSDVGIGRHHRGTDICVRPGSPVLAPVGGEVVDIAFGGLLDRWSAVSVRNDDHLHVLKPLSAPFVRLGAIVTTGDVLGTVADISIVGCNVPSGRFRRHTSLHWELWSRSEHAYAPCPVLDPTHGWQACNPVYASRMNACRSPVEHEDCAFAGTSGLRQPDNWHGGHVPSPPSA